MIICIALPAMHRSEMNKEIYSTQLVRNWVTLHSNITPLVPAMNYLHRNGDSVTNWSPGCGVPEARTAMNYPGTARTVQDTFITSISVQLLKEAFGRHFFKG